MKSPVASRAVTTATFGILADPGAASLKRIAWAFGCAAKGSDDERRLEEILLERARREQTQKLPAPTIPL